MAVGAALPACLPAEADPTPDAGLTPGDTDGGGPVPPAALPTSPPNCAADAVTIEAEVTGPGPYTRAENVDITYRVYAHGVVQIFARGDLGGHFGDAGEGHATFQAGGGPDDPEGANGALWQGPYHIELAAQDKDGCIDTIDLNVPMVGDVAVGDSSGDLHVKGSDGRGVVLLGHPADQPITALIVAPDAPRGFVAGFGQGLEGAPFIARLDEKGTLVTRFAEVDLTGEPLFPEGHPRHLMYEPTSGEILSDGPTDGTVLRFNALGDYLGRYLIPAGDSHDHVALGFARQGGRAIAGTSATDQLWFVSDTPEIFADTGGSFNRLFTVASGFGADEVLAVHSADDYVNTLTIYGTGGQEIHSAEIGDLQPEHIIRFRDGYLSTGNLDPMRRIDRDLNVLEPTAGGDNWDDFGTFGYSQTGGIAWLNETDE